ncbi:hypothetical protein HWD32_gp49 [Gordonia phage Secretariat]|uniref:Uncharacterized protein n=1 Tax=Gordonia phage Secretariat TaxID=2725616 RepID=A0A6M3SUT6_9CAUD|nr:hypothetical protein HWD32_gp49 [Gordonia phage Secretariat]QJD49626.1 hypothetical protein SEA_SECRETARIAT_49 [Gordonia phage Secretariat]
MHEEAVEKGIDEPVHEDIVVRSRMSECTISDCPNGCKYYHDSKTGYVALGHNPSYGCKITKSDIQAKEKVSAQSV